MSIMLDDPSHIFPIKGADGKLEKTQVIVVSPLKTA